MLIAIITAFALCWLPIQIFQLVVYFSPNILDNSSDTKYYTFVGTYFVCHWISMAHSFMNPIIYSFMSKSFKVSLIVAFYKKSASLDANIYFFVGGRFYSRI